MQCHFDSIRLQHAHRRSTYKPHIGSALQPLFEDFLAHAQIKPVEKDKDTRAAYRRSRVFRAIYVFGKSRQHTYRHPYESPNYGTL